MARAIVLLAATGLLLVTVAAPVAGGGGGHGGGNPCAGFTEGSEVVLRDFCLDGTAHFMPGSSDLIVVNAGQVPHDYVAVDGSFRTGVLQPGARATVERPGVGVHRVHCTLHASDDGQGMAGVLVVGATDSSALTAPAGAAAEQATSGGFRPLAGGLTVAGLAVALALALVAIVWHRRTATRVDPEPGRSFP